MEKPDFHDTRPYPKQVWNARMVSVSRYDEDPAMNRLQILARHFIGYFTVAAVWAVFDLMAEPQRFWFVWFMVAWGAPLAIHVAYVMGLFGGANPDAPDTDSQREAAKDTDQQAP